MSPDKLSLLRLGEMKRRGEKIVMITAYDAPSARLADEQGMELLLVGDSASMVVMGHESTLPVTLDEMVLLTAAVSRGARRALVVGDLPFGSYQPSDEVAVQSAVRMVKDAGADLVKLEGSERRLSRVRAIIDAGIPVMGHIGLTPQSIHALGGFKVQGKRLDGAQAIVDDAVALAEAGCFAIVLECVPDGVARMVTDSVDVPTIGIGAGRHCDGQVLVFHDLLGFTSPERSAPKFVRRYATLEDQVLAVPLE